MTDTLDLTDFNKTVEGFLDRIPVRVSLAQRKIALDLLAGVVRRTPVDTGRARGNWQLSIGHPAKGVLDRKMTKRNKTIKEEQAKLKKLPPFGVVWLSNNLPYIEALEFGKFVPKNPGPSKDSRKKRKGKTWVKGGYSVQAPKGMVRVTLAQIASELQETLDKF